MPVTSRWDEKTKQRIARSKSTSAGAPASTGFAERIRAREKADEYFARTVMGIELKYSDIQRHRRWR